MVAPDMGKLAAGWTYKDQADEMRGKTTRFARFELRDSAERPQNFTSTGAMPDPQIAIRGSVDDATPPEIRPRSALFSGMRRQEVASVS